MAPRFRNFFIFCLCWLVSSGSAFAAEASKTAQSSETLEMVAKRMRSLTHSLEGMPQPPALDQTIQLPDAVLAIPLNGNSKKEKK